MGSCKVNPHKGKELEYLMNGIKPMCTLSLDDPESNKVLNGSLMYLTTVVVDTIEQSVTVTKRENAFLHGIMNFLTSENAHMMIRSKTEKHRMIGRLFGYTEDQIDEFLLSDEARDCKCQFCREL